MMLGLPSAIHRTARTLPTSSTQDISAGSRPSPALQSPEPEASSSSRTEALHQLVESPRFNMAIAMVIAANAVVLGLETYSGLSPSFRSFLLTANLVFYSIFVVELLLRIASYGRRPWLFFTNKWNVFDFIVVVAVLFPFVREQATIMRLLRLARVARIMRVLPEARILMSAVGRSMPAMATMGILSLIVMFMYAMLGWTLFGEALPDSWGTVGQSMMTLFILLTLEDFPRLLEAAQAVSPWAAVFFLSYVLVAAFVIVNLFIGIVVNAMDQARSDHGPHPAQPADPRQIEQRMSELQVLLEQYMHAEGNVQQDKELVA